MGVHGAAPERQIHEKPMVGIKPKILHAAIQTKCLPDAPTFEKLMSKSTTEAGASGAAPPTKSERK